MSRRLSFYPLAAAAALVILFSLYRLTVALPRGSDLDHVSGVWTTMALDASDGLFYRPLFEDGGYGGTRFFPLYFVLHAGLIRAFGHPVATGYALSILSTLALVAGAFYFLREEGAEAGLAACGAVAVLATMPAQLALTTIRGDALSAALSVWGLALVVKALRREDEFKKLLVSAGVLFALACLAKVTAVYGLLASCLALYLHERKRSAASLAATALSVIAAGVGVTELASGGRFLESILACSSGGATLESTLSAPLTLIQVAFYRAYFGPLVIVLALGGVATALVGRGGRELPTLAFVFTLVVTLLIFGSRGINYNHLLDLYVMCFLIFVAQIGRGRINFGVGVTALALLCSLLLYDTFDSCRVSDRQDNLTRYSEIARDLKGEGGPVLSENPWFPIFAGERPFLLDPFMFQVLSRSDSHIKEDLNQKLDRHFFRSVVLARPPDVADEAEWYRSTHFGQGFIQRMNASYRLSKKERGVVIYSPR